MKTAKVSQLRNGLSRFLAYVRRGGRVRVFDRETPIAEIVPVSASRSGARSEIEAILDRLERQGSVVRGKGKLPADFFTRPRPKPKASVLEALLEERREGR
ncbi:MAG: hypothetical protein L0216_11110 [Planctomycetales bacterium]|nr:hypothetical protein [Planctomycetales bacterium]